MAAGPASWLADWLVLGASDRSIEAHCSVVNLGNRVQLVQRSSTRASERTGRGAPRCGMRVGSSGRARSRARGRPAVRPTRGGGGAHTAGVRACLPAAAWVGLARTRTTQTAHVDSLACLTTRSLSPIDPRTSRHSRSRLASTTPRAPRHACTDALWAVARGRPGASSLVTQCTQQAASAAPATPCCCCCVHGSCRASGHRSVRSIDREVAAS